MVIWLCRELDAWKVRTWKSNRTSCRKFTSTHIPSRPSICNLAVCPADGAAPTGLSWSSSLAVVTVSFSGLFCFVLLLLACICCKRRRRNGFKVGVCSQLSTHTRTHTLNYISFSVAGGLNADGLCVFAPQQRTKHKHCCCPRISVIIVSSGLPDLPFRRG